MQTRLTQVAAKYGEMAPAAATCCNACRTCVQTNLLTAAFGAVAAAWAFVVRRRELANAGVDVEVGAHRAAHDENRRLDALDADDIATRP